MKRHFKKKKKARPLINTIARLLGRIHQRLQTEEELRQFEIEYRTLIEHIPAITYVAALDESSTILYVSPQVEALLGLTPTDYLSDHDFWQKHLHPDDRERVLAEVAQSHDTGGPFVSEYRMVTKDGRVLWFRDEAWIVRDADNHPLFLQGVMLNITQRREAEEELRQYHGQLEKLVEERTAALTRANVKLQEEIRERQLMAEALQKSAEKFKLFAYSIIHDLKNPVLAIQGLSQFLHKHYNELLDQRGIKICEQLVRSSEQIATLLRGITVYIVAKEAPLNIKPVKLKDILELVKEEFATQLELRGIRWSEPEDLPDIRADGLSILRALRNLVDNALKYGGEGLSEITISYEKSGGYHHLSVWDNGVGIALKDHDKLFELFQRPETSIGLEGSGLGLAIVKEIAEKHGGKVWVESSPEAGTIFHLAIADSL